ncbi:hypothetical protein [Planococcus koreensis]|uniref:hypothetical protein n=1 Tax=Planococcus koreensis TaxID=112331 RepID=UPI0039FB9E51
MNRKKSSVSIGALVLFLVLLGACSQAAEETEETDGGDSPPLAEFKEIRKSISPSPRDQDLITTMIWSSWSMVMMRAR